MGTTFCKFRKRIHQAEQKVTLLRLVSVASKSLKLGVRLFSSLQSLMKSFRRSKMQNSKKNKTSSKCRTKSLRLSLAFPIKNPFDPVWRKNILPYTKVDLERLSSSQDKIKRLWFSNWMTWLTILNGLCKCLIMAFKWVQIKPRLLLIRLILLSHRESRVRWRALGCNLCPLLQGITLPTCFYLDTW